MRLPSLPRAGGFKTDGGERGAALTSAAAGGAAPQRSAARRGVSGQHEALPAPLGTGPRPAGRIKSDRFESRRFPKGSAVPTRRACERDEIITSRE